MADDLSESSEIEVKPNRGDGRLFFLLLLLSLLWVLLAWIWGYRDDVNGDGRTYSAMSADEMGTFLQGIFAPITFLWLVGAVWFQTRELREQRKELELTRREVRSNRTVAEAQALQMKAQVTIMREEAEQRRQDRAEHDVRGVLDEFGNLILNILEEVDQEKYSQWYDRLSAFEKFVHLSWQFANELKAGRIHADWFPFIESWIEAVEASAPNLSDGARVRLSLHRVEQLRAALDLAVGKQVPVIDDARGN